MIIPVSSSPLGDDSSIDHDEKKTISALFLDAVFGAKRSGSLSSSKHASASSSSREDAGRASSLLSDEARTTLRFEEKENGRHEERARVYSASASTERTHLVNSTPGARGPPPFGELVVPKKEKKHGKGHSRHSSFGSTYDFMPPDDRRRRLLEQRTSTSSKWLRLSQNIQLGRLLVLNETSRFATETPARGAGLRYTWPATAAEATTTRTKTTITPAEGMTGMGGTILDREAIRKKVQDGIRLSMEFTLQQCMLAIAAYVLIAALAYSVILAESWTVVDSMYFAVVTFTTIGYGDLVPTTTAGRVFTAFFAVSGVACLGIALGVVGSNLIRDELKAVDRARKRSTRNAITLLSSEDGGTIPSAVGGGDFDEENPRSSFPTIDECDEGDEEVSPSPRGPAGQITSFEGRRESSPADDENPIPEQSAPSPSSWSSLGGCCKRLCIVVAILVPFGLLLVIERPEILQGRDWGTAFYFSTITACTVGYGDYAPTSQAGRFVAIFLIPIGVGVMGHWLSLVAGYIIERRQRGFRDRLATFELSIEDLEAMDENNDGQVCEAEFLEFMLVTLNKVDQELMDELRALFARLDADGTGSLNKDDLIEVAKRKLRSSRHKLELAQYKRQLMEKAYEAKRKQQRRRQRGGSLVLFPVEALQGRFQR